MSADSGVDRARKAFEEEKARKQAALERARAARMDGQSQPEDTRSEEEKARKAAALERARAASGVDRARKAFEEEKERKAAALERARRASSDAYPGADPIMQRTILVALMYAMFQFHFSTKPSSRPKA